MKTRGMLFANGVLGVALPLSAFQTTGERLVALNRDVGALKPPEAAELPGSSVFVTLNTRKGETQTFALVKAVKPVANMLLFAGGYGMLKLIKSASSRSGMNRGGLKGNFFIRTKEEFISHGLNAVLVDAPSDKQGRNSKQVGFRNSARHVKDLEGVIGLARRRIGLPVWLVGTSRGTELTAFAAIHCRGPVLTSSVKVSNRNGIAVTSYALKKIRALVQIVFHDRDGSTLTLASGARAIARSLVGAAMVEPKAFDGGNPAASGPRGAQSEHGFLGIEGRIVEAITSFIKANL